MQKQVDEAIRLYNIASNAVLLVRNRYNILTLGTKTLLRQKKKMQQNDLHIEREKLIVLIETVSTAKKAAEADAAAQAEAEADAAAASAQAAQAEQAEADAAQAAAQAEAQAEAADQLVPSLLLSMQNAIKATQNAIEATKNAIGAMQDKIDTTYATFILDVDAIQKQVNEAETLYKTARDTIVLVLAALKHDDENNILSGEYQIQLDDLNYNIQVLKRFAYRVVQIKIPEIAKANPDEYKIMYTVLDSALDSAQKAIEVVQKAINAAHIIVDVDALQKQIIVVEEAYNIAGTAVTTVVHVVTQYHSILPQNTKKVLLQEQAKLIHDLNTQLTIKNTLAQKATLIAITPTADAESRATSAAILVAHAEAAAAQAEAQAKAEAEAEAKAKAKAEAEANYAADAEIRALAAAAQEKTKADAAAAQAKVEAEAAATQTEADAAATLLATPQTKVIAEVAVATEVLNDPFNFKEFLKDKDIIIETIRRKLNTRSAIENIIACIERIVKCINNMGTIIDRYTVSINKMKKIKNFEIPTGTHSGGNITYKIEINNFFYYEHVEKFLEYILILRTDTNKYKKDLILTKYINCINFIFNNNFEVNRLDINDLINFLEKKIIINNQLYYLQNKINIIYFIYKYINSKNYTNFLNEMNFHFILPTIYKKNIIQRINKDIYRIDYNLNEITTILDSINTLLKLEPSEYITRIDLGIDAKIIDIEKLLKLRSLNHKIINDTYNSTLGNNIIIPNATYFSCLAQNVKTIILQKAVHSKHIIKYLLTGSNFIYSGYTIWNFYKTFITIFFNTFFNQYCYMSEISIIITNEIIEYNQILFDTIKNCKKKYCIINLLIPGHQNLLIIDTINYNIYHFEPNSYSFYFNKRHILCQNWSYEDNKITKSIIIDFINNNTNYDTYINYIIDTYLTYDSQNLTNPSNHILHFNASLVHSASTHDISYIIGIHNNIFLEKVKRKFPQFSGSVCYLRYTQGDSTFVTKIITILTRCLLKPTSTQLKSTVTYNNVILQSYLYETNLLVFFKQNLPNYTFIPAYALMSTVVDFIDQQNLPGIDPGGYCVTITFLYLFLILLYYHNLRYLKSQNNDISDKINLSLFMAKWKYNYNDYKISQTDTALNLPAKYNNINIVKDFSIIIFQYLYLFIVTLFNNNNYITLQIDTNDTENSETINNVIDYIHTTKNIKKEYILNKMYYLLYPIHWPSIIINNGSLHENKTSYQKSPHALTNISITYYNDFIIIIAKNKYNKSCTFRVEIPIENFNIYDLEVVNYNNIIYETLRLYFLSFLFDPLNTHNMNDSFLFNINTDITPITGNNFIKFLNLCHTTENINFKKYLKYKLKYLQLKKL